MRRCACFFEAEAQRRLDAAAIPRRYENADFEHFYKYAGMSGSIDEASMIAEKYVEQFPNADHGLLFSGPAGVGKTHLAVAILRALMHRYSVSARFVDYRELLASIQNSYNPLVETSELDILRPILRVNVLLLDELGTRRPTDWVRDIVTHILNDRYQEQRITLVTTNYVDDPDTPEDYTLEDRIGKYARSRLHEMCRTVRMTGSDYRKLISSASTRARSSQSAG